jgi:hypothetical protein
MKHYSDRDESGPAADTGSAVHMAANAFHSLKSKAKGNARLSVGVMRAALSEYPLADLDAAEKTFLRYSEDERNKEAEIVLCEGKVNCTLPPWKDDPTQEEIYLIGTLDQIRRVDGRLVCCDIKNGQRLDGFEMIHSHALQLAAYQLAASKLIGERVDRACIIRTQDYVRQGKRGKALQDGPVFWNCPWSLSQAVTMLDSVRRVVASVRRGGVYAAPNEGCRWCIGIGECLPKLEALNLEKCR